MLDLKCYMGINKNIGFRIDELQERKRIGKRLVDFRKEYGLTQRDLAELSGINYTSICKIEGGRYSCGLDILSKIGRLFGKRIDYVDDNTENLI